MRQKHNTPEGEKRDLKAEADQLVRNIKRQTRRKFNAEEKIRIVLAGLRGEDSIAEICRREGIHQNLYYKWSKEFLEAGKKRLTGDTEREAGSSEVKALRTESAQLKEALAEVLLETVGDAEDAAQAADVLAHDQHLWVALHRAPQPEVEGLAEGELGLTLHHRPPPLAPAPAGAASSKEAR